MSDNLITLRYFLRKWIKEIANNLTGKTIHSIYLEFLPDTEHDDLDFYLYISTSADKRDWYEESYGVTEMETINVSEEDEKLMGQLYEYLDDANALSKLLLSTLAKLNYAQLNLDENCAFKVAYSNDW